MSKTKAAILLLTGLLLLLGLFSLFAHLGQRKDTAVREALEAARAALAEGRMEAAEAGFRDLLALDPRQPEAAAALFDLAIYFDPDQAAEWLAALKGMQAAPALVLHREARMAVQQQDLPRARRAVERLESLGLGGTEPLLAKLMLLVAEEQFAEALPLLASLSEAFPEDRQIRLLSSQVYTNLDGPLGRIQAKQTLFALLDYPDEFAFKAGVLLALNPRLPLFSDDLELVADALGGHPHLGAGVRQLDPLIARELVLRFSHIRPALAHRLSSILVRRPDAGPEDRLVHLYAQQLSGDWQGAAAPAVAEAAEAAPLQAGIVLLARQRILEGTQAEAIALVDGLLAVDPANPNALHFLNWLAEERFSALDNAGKQWLARTLRAHPDTAVGLQLDAVAFLAADQPDQHEALLDQATARFAGSHRPELCRWLVAIGEYSRVLDLISEPDALADRDLLFNRVDAHTFSGQHEAAIQLLQRAGSLIEPALRDLLIARIHLRMGDPDACLRIISGLPATLPPGGRAILFPIAELAELTGAAALQRKAYDLAYGAGLVFPPNHAMNYLSLLLEGAELQRSLDFSAYCRNLVPDNPFYVNNHTYMKMVAGRWAEDCITDMRAIVESHPDVPYFRLTYALAQVMGGYSGRALETLKQLDREALPQEPRSRLTYALVLAGTGSQDAARPIIQEINTDELMDRERVLIDRYLRDGRFQPE